MRVMLWIVRSSLNTGTFAHPVQSLYHCAGVQGGKDQVPDLSCIQAQAGGPRLPQLSNQNHIRHYPDDVDEPLLKVLKWIPSSLLKKRTDVLEAEFHGILQGDDVQRLGQILSAPVSSIRGMATAAKIPKRTKTLITSIKVNAD